MAQYQRRGVPPDTAPNTIRKIDPSLLNEPESSVSISRDDFALGEVVEVETAAATTAAFVRIKHNQVGRYAQGSIVPAIAFEYLSNLLELGAVEYAPEATTEHLEGDPSHLALLSGSVQSISRTIPPAPWINASPSNLLGAAYIPLGKSTHSWSPPFTTNAPTTNATSRVG